VKHCYRVELGIVTWLMLMAVDVCCFGVKSVCYTVRLLFLVDLWSLTFTFSFDICT